MTGVSFIVSKPAHHNEEECGHLSLNVSRLYVSLKLPFVKPFKDETYCLEPKWWGVFFHPFRQDDKTIMVYYGGESPKIIDMPWQWEFVGHGEKSGGISLPFYCKHEDKIVEAGCQTHIYKYRWKCLKWVPQWTNNLATKEVKRLNIKFSEEVGSRCGTWKGGTLEISTLLGPHQSISDKLKEFEKEGV